MKGFNVYQRKFNDTNLFMGWHSLASDATNHARGIIHNDTDVSAVWASDFEGNLKFLAVRDRNGHVAVYV